jgi:hypothetical protein
MIFQLTEGVYRIPEYDLIITEEITFEEHNKYRNENCKRNA